MQDAPTVAQPSDSVSGTAAASGTGTRGLKEPVTADICVIGAGSGGLSVAAAASALGEKVVLIEKHRMGGDCLNTGCVPSKALLAAARRAHETRMSAPFGIKPFAPEIDMLGVRDHVRGVIAAIAPNDSVERFSGLGVTVIQAAATFIDPCTVEAGGFRIVARRFVIATGSSPLVPPIPGLETIPYFTNETIFDNGEKLAHLIVIGGGPIGLEMAQAHVRLGSRVTVLEAGRPFGRDDPEMAAVVLKALAAEGVTVMPQTAVTRVDGGYGLVRIRVASPSGEETLEGSHILVAAGRKPNTDGLGLEAAKVRLTPGGGIKVSAGMKTTNSRIYAIGDVVGGPMFTHVANHHAGIVIRNALFRLPAKFNPREIPWVTFTEPELAHVGLSETEARKTFGRVNVLRWPYHENDRAQAERATEGHVKVVTDSRGRIVGADIVGLHAGELIGMWALAVSQRLSIKAMTGWISPYPTLNEINKRAAYRYYATAASNPLVRKVIRWMKVLG